MRNQMIPISGTTATFTAKFNRIGSRHGKGIRTMTALFTHVRDIENLPVCPHVWGTIASRPEELRMVRALASGKKIRFVAYVRFYTRGDMTVDCCLDNVRLIREIPN